MQTIFSLCAFSFRPPAKKLRGWKPRTGVLHPDERDVTIEPERRRRATSSIASSAKRAPEARHTFSPGRANQARISDQTPRRVSSTAQETPPQNSFSCDALLDFVYIELPLAQQTRSR